jgi:hypothetical protein
MNLSRPLALLLTFGSLSGLAWGQIPTRTEPFPQLPNARRVGPFLLDPRFTIYNIGYDNNIFLAPENAAEIGSARSVESDVVVSFGPSLEGQIRFGQRVALTFKDRLQAEVFLTNSSLNHVDNSLETQFDLLVGPLLLTTTLDDQDSEQRPNSEIDERPQLDLRRLAQTARLFLGAQFDFVAKVSETRYRLSDPNDPNIGVRLNRDSSEAFVELGWLPRSQLRFFVRRSDRDDDFVLDADDTVLARGNVDSEDRRSLFGVELRPRGSISGKIMLGSARMKPTSSFGALAPFDGSVYDATVAYRPSGRSRLTLEAHREPVFSIAPNNFHFVREGESLSVNWYLGARWGIQAGTDRERLIFPEPYDVRVINSDGSSSLVRIERSDEIDNYYAGALFRMSSGFELGLRVGRRQRDSEDPFARDNQSYVSTTGSYYF